MIAPLVWMLLTAAPTASDASLPPAGPVLTLAEAMQQARERNNDLKVIQAKLTQVQQTASKVWANYLPQVSVGGSYTRNSAEARIALPTGYYIRNVFQEQGPAFDPTQPVSLDNPPGAPTTYIMVPSALTEALIQPLNQLGAQGQVSQALVAPALWAGIKSAYLGERIAELSSENARLEVLFAVAQLYYGAVALAQGVQVQERMLQMNQAHEKDARLRYDAGQTPKVAFLRAEIERAKAEQDLKRTRNSLLAAKYSLATLLDREPNFEVAPPPEPALPAGTEESVIQEAPSKRFDVMAARAGNELAEHQRSSLWLKYLPTAGLSGLFRVSNSGGFTGENHAWAISLGLSWQLWDGGLREAEARENAAKLLESEAALRAATARSKDDVRRAFLDLDSAQANLKKASEQLALAKESMSLVKVGYDSGTATYLEVADAQAALFAAEMSVVGESLNAQLARLKLLKAGGHFAP